MTTLETTALERTALRSVMASFAGPTAPGWLFDRLRGGLGSVCLFRSNIESPEQLARLTAAIRDANPGVLIALDEEGGDVTRLHHGDGSPHPGNAALGAVDDPARTAAVAAAIGAELAEVGVDLDLAPVVDVNSDPANPVIGVRSFGADPELVARHTRAYVDGMQSSGVGACAKHFPGHGDTAVDSHLGMPVVTAPVDVLRARELLPFRAAVESGAVAVMTAHLVATAVDARFPATVSPAANRLLRSELGFRGLVVSDALDMAGLAAVWSAPDAAVSAISAGCDLLCLGADGEAGDVDVVVSGLVAAVRDGRLPEGRLVEAGERVAAAVERIHGWRGAGAFPTYDAEVGLSVAHDAIAVTGTLPDLRGATVLRFQTEANFAVGPTAWGLPLDGVVLGGRPPIDVVESTTVADVVGEGSRAVVALVRDAHRHGWVRDRLTELAARSGDGPPLVVVEMGWPGDGEVPGAAVVRTYGASRVSGEALDALLGGDRS